MAKDCMSKAVMVSSSEADLLWGHCHYLKGFDVPKISKCCNAPVIRVIGTYRCEKCDKYLHDGDYINKE